MTMLLGCILCRYDIPPERARRHSITCSKLCQTIYRINRMKEYRERRRRQIDKAVARAIKKFQKSQGTPFPVQQEAN